MPTADALDEHRTEEIARMVEESLVPCKMNDPEGKGSGSAATTDGLRRRPSTGDTGNPDGDL